MKIKKMGMKQYLKELKERRNECMNYYLPRYLEKQNWMLVIQESSVLLQLDAEIRLLEGILGAIKNANV